MEMTKAEKQAIDDATLSRIAGISRLKLSEDEREALRKDLNGILSQFSLIREIEARGSELYYVKPGESIPRKDESQECAEAPAIRSQFSRKKETGEMLAPKSL